MIGSTIHRYGEHRNGACQRGIEARTVERTRRLDGRLCFVPPLPDRHFEAEFRSLTAASLITAVRRAYGYAAYSGSIFPAHLMNVGGADTFRPAYNSSADILTIAIVFAVVRIALL